jgi:Nif-specific regulatory protein
MNMPRERILNALTSIAQVLGGIAGNRPAISAVLEILECDLGMTHSTVLLLSADSNELLVHALSDPLLPEQESVRYRKGEGIVGRVLETGVAAIIPRISEKLRIDYRKFFGSTRKPALI